jgi:hypothetical protein
MENLWGSRERNWSGREDVTSFFSFFSPISFLSVFVGVIVLSISPSMSLYNLYFVGGVCW